MLIVSFYVIGKDGTASDLGNGNFLSVKIKVVLRTVRDERYLGDARSQRGMIISIVPSTIKPSYSYTTFIPYNM
jgi:hypothetical protein